MEEKEAEAEFSLALGLWMMLNMSLGSCSAPTCRCYAPSVPLAASLGPCLSPCHWSRHPIMGWVITARLKHGTFQMIGLSGSVTLTIINQQQ